MALQLPHEVGAKEPKRPDTKNDQSGSPRKAKVELLSVKDPEEKVDAGSDSIGLEQKLVQALSSKMEEGTVDWEKVLGVVRECPEATAMKEAVDMIRPYNPPRHVVEFFLSDLEGIAKLKTLLSFNNPPNELVDALVKTIPDDVLQSSCGITIDGPILDLTEKKKDEMSLVGMKLIALVLKKNTSVKCLKRGHLINIPIHGGIEGDDEVIEQLSLLSSKDLEPIDGIDYWYWFNV